MASERQNQAAATRTAKRKASAVAVSEAPLDDAVSHNLYGQRLGRKGRDTRDRIIAAAQSLLSRPDPIQITLSAVAREASLGMTTLYLYFTDLTELLLAVLEPVMVTADDAYLAEIRKRWPDDTLGAHCRDFLGAFYDFWNRNARILHLRNAMADQGDQRMMFHRVDSAQALINLIVVQMDGDPDDTHSPAYDMATVLMTGIERAVTMATNMPLQGLIGNRGNREVQDSRRLIAVSRLLELGIREHRA